VHRRELTILIDSNIFISLESVGTVDAPEVTQAAEFSRLAGSLGARITIAAGTRKDLSNAPVDRQRTRFAQLRKHFVLEAVNPSPTLAARGEFPSSPLQNDLVDLEILSVLETGVADWLVTEDGELRKRARKAGLGDRVFSLNDVNQTLRSFLSQPTSLSSVRTVPGYTMDLSAPFSTASKQTILASPALPALLIGGGIELRGPNATYSY
jgi:hypothetical protein